MLEAERCVEITGQMGDWQRGKTKGGSE